MATTGAPAPRRYHVAVWSGTRMLVWGGSGDAQQDQALADGAAYDPAADRWTPFSSAGAPPGRWAHSGVWTGRELLVFGGLGCSRNEAGEPELCGSGGRYDPVADRWASMSSDGAPPHARGRARCGPARRCWCGPGPPSGAPTAPRDPAPMVQPMIRSVTDGVRSALPSSPPAAPATPPPGRARRCWCGVGSSPAADRRGPALLARSTAPEARFAPRWVSRRPWPLWQCAPPMRRPWARRVAPGGPARGRRLAGAGSGSLADLDRGPARRSWITDLMLRLVDAAPLLPSELQRWFLEFWGPVQA
jgi:hypothetical protein